MKLVKLHDQTEKRQQNHDKHENEIEYRKLNYQPWALRMADASSKPWIKKKNSSEENTRTVVEEVYRATIGGRLCKSVLATWSFIFTQGKRWAWDLGKRKESAKESARKKKREMNQITKKVLWSCCHFHGTFHIGHH